MAEVDNLTLEVKALITTKKARTHPEEKRNYSLFNLRETVWKKTF